MSFQNRHLPARPLEAAANKLYLEGSVVEVGFTKEEEARLRLMCALISNPALNATLKGETSESYIERIVSNILD